jgi:hypothetical protein
MDKLDDIWRQDEGGEKTRPKTFWLLESTLEKIKLLQAQAADPDKVIRRIKLAIEKEVDQLFELRPKK